MEFILLIYNNNVYDVYFTITQLKCLVALSRFLWLNFVDRLTPDSVKISSRFFAGFNVIVALQMLLLLSLTMTATL